MFDVLQIVGALGYDEQVANPSEEIIQKVQNVNENLNVAKDQSLWILILRNLQKTFANVAGNPDWKDFADCDLPVPAYRELIKSLMMLQREN